MTAFIALAGVGTVAATWWLGEIDGRPMGGLIAGLFAAVSPAAIEQSTFIWNPNLIPGRLGRSGSHARGGRGRWSARGGGSARGLGVGIVMQCHVLGVILLPGWPRCGWPTSAGPAAIVARRSCGRDSLARLSSPDVRAARHPRADALVRRDPGDRRVDRAPAEEPGPSLLERLPTVTWRVLAWPLAALITDRPIVAILRRCSSSWPSQSAGRSIEVRSGSPSG